MTKRSGLGRGLDALIPLEETPGSGESTGGITHLPVNVITRNPHQPRMRFDAAELDELAASIREHGILQPLIVTHGPTAELYTLVAGERRLLAARQAGLSSVPVIVRDATPQQLVELALVENVQRADLGPLETAEAYRQLHEVHHLSQEEIAQRVGKSRVAITNTLRLLKLPEAVKQALAEGRITEGHARALLALPTPQAQLAALETILKNDLTVRQSEAYVRRLCGEKPPATPKAARPPELADIEARLRAHLGTKVKLNPHGKGGSLVIHYYSDEELTALMEKILGER